MVELDVAQKELCFTSENNLGVSSGFSPGARIANQGKRGDV